MTVSISLQYARVRRLTISSRLAAFWSARMPAEACLVVGMRGTLPRLADDLTSAPLGELAVWRAQPRLQIALEAQPATGPEAGLRELLELFDWCFGRPH